MEHATRVLFAATRREHRGRVICGTHSARGALSPCIRRVAEHSTRVACSTRSLRDENLPAHAGHGQLPLRRLPAGQCAGQGTHPPGARRRDAADVSAAHARRNCRVPRHADFLRRHQCLFAAEVRAFPPHPALARRHPQSTLAAQARGRQRCEPDRRTGHWRAHALHAPRRRRPAGERTR